MTRAPGRPRSAEANEAILGATLELLAGDGYAALTMERVRERAGVGKATIYRRWGSKEELVAAEAKMKPGRFHVSALPASGVSERRRLRCKRTSNARGPARS